MTPNDDDRRAADRFLFSLTLRLAGVDTDTRAYELTDDEIAALSVAFGLAAERRGIERAVVACENERLPEPQDETDAAYDHAIDHCIEAIRSLNEGA